MQNYISNFFFCEIQISYLFVTLKLRLQLLIYKSCFVTLKQLQNPSQPSSVYWLANHITAHYYYCCGGSKLDYDKMCLNNFTHSDVSMQIFPYNHKMWYTTAGCEIICKLYFTSAKPFRQ